MKYVTSLYAVFSLALLASSAHVCAMSKSLSKNQQIPSSSSSSSSSSSLVSPKNAIAIASEQQAARTEAFINKFVELAQADNQNILTDSDVRSLKNKLQNDSIARFEGLVKAYNEACKATFEKASYLAQAKNFLNYSPVITKVQQDALKQELIEKSTLVASNLEAETLTAHAVEIFDAYVASQAPAKTVACRISWIKASVKPVAGAVLALVAATLMIKTGAYKKLSFKTARRA